MRDRKDSLRPFSSSLLFFWENRGPAYISPISKEPVHCDCDDEKHKRHGQQVGVIVAEDITEDWEFVDYFDVVATKVDIFDYATSPPPPAPATVDVPEAGNLRLLREVVDIDQSIQAIKTYALGIQPLKNDVQV